MSFKRHWKCRYWRILYLIKAASTNNQGEASSQSSQAHHTRSHTDSENTESQSICSCGSSESYSVRSDDDRSSPASTTLRPRFGQEYKKLDRRKLADDLNIGLEPSTPRTPRTPHTPQSPSGTSSVFTFDTHSMASSGISASFSGGGENSPKSPSLYKRHHKDPVYVNVTTRTDSPHNVMDYNFTVTPPGSPRSFISTVSEMSNPALNYAEIDLSSTGDSSRPRRTSTRTSDVEYATIDMVATAAASRVGKEHAQLREDSLRRKSRKASDSDYRDFTRRGKDRKSSAPSSASKERKSTASSKTAVKDRKYSSPM